MLTNPKAINYEVLIKKQIIEVLSNNGSAIKLAQLYKEYQLYTENSNSLIQQLPNYFAALFLSHNFVELRCVVERYANLLAIKNDSELDLYREIAKFGRKNYIKNLLTKVVQLEIISKSLLKPLFIKAAKAYIIKFLTKNYINFQISYLNKHYDITNEDLLENNCTIDDKYVVLPVQKNIERIDQLMRERIKQVSAITENVIKSGQSNWV